MQPLRRGIRRFDPDGNDRLTSSAGLVLVVLSGAEIATLLIGLQVALSWHVAIGLMLLPPIALKLASTGWRFIRYYTGNAAYREKGAPQLAMRLLAPVLVFFTIAVFGSGVAMGLVHGQALQVARRIHGPAAVGWMVLIGLHVLIYFRHALRSTAADLFPSRPTGRAGGRVRGALVATALVIGLIVALATRSASNPWLHLHSGHNERDRPSRASPGATSSRVASSSAT